MDMGVEDDDDQHNKTRNDVQVVLKIVVDVLPLVNKNGFDYKWTLKSNLTLLFFINGYFIKSCQAKNTKEGQVLNGSTNYSIW